jgi:CDP-diacylglycerol--glycerol-3-phosphate 3-phosphatidyltransferase
LLSVLWRNLDANHRQGELALLPTLGWGNFLTLGRGVLTAMLLGFLGLPQPQGWLAWLPGILYVLSDAADFFDGYVARRTNHATRLGEILDMSFDGLGVLAAALLSVQYGQAPLWYLAVALARPLFLAGLWLRRRLHLPIYEPPPSLSRRIFAGLQMGFLAVILLPIFSPPGAHIAAALFGLPLLAGFLRDWLYVSGLLKPRQAAPAVQSNASHWLPALLRAAILMLNLPVLVAWLNGFPDQTLAFSLLGGLNAILVLALFLGVMPRIAAIGALCVLGFYQMLAPLAPFQIFLAFLYAAILFSGGGAFALWTPEERLFQRRAGERELQDSERSR